MASVLENALEGLQSTSFDIGLHGGDAYAIAKLIDNYDKITQSMLKALMDTHIKDWEAVTGIDYPDNLKKSLVELKSRDLTSRQRGYLKLKSNIIGAGKFILNKIGVPKNTISNISTLIKNLTKNETDLIKTVTGSVKTGAAASAAIKKPSVIIKGGKVLGKAAFKGLPALGAGLNLYDFLYSNEKEKDELVDTISNTTYDEDPRKNQQIKKILTDSANDSFKTKNFGSVVNGLASVSTYLSPGIGLTAMAVYSAFDTMRKLENDAKIKRSIFWADFTPADIFLNPKSSSEPNKPQLKIQGYEHLEKGAIAQNRVFETLRKNTIDEWGSSYADETEANFKEIFKDLSSLPPNFKINRNGEILVDGKKYTGNYELEREKIKDITPRLKEIFDDIEIYGGGKSDINALIAHTNNASLVSTARGGIGSDGNDRNLRRSDIFSAIQLLSDNEFRENVEKRSLDSNIGAGDKSIEDIINSVREKNERGTGTISHQLAGKISDMNSIMASNKNPSTLINKWPGKFSDGVMQVSYDKNTGLKYSDAVIPQPAPVVFSSSNSKPTIKKTRPTVTPKNNDIIKSKDPFEFISSIVKNVGSIFSSNNSESTALNDKTPAPTSMFNDFEKNDQASREALSKALSDSVKNSSQVKEASSANVQPIIVIPRQVIN